MSRWFIITNQLKAGPFKKGFVKQLYEQGVIRADSIIWQEGDAKAQSYQQYFNSKLTPTITLESPKIQIDVTDFDESPPELFIEKTGSHEIAKLWQEFHEEESHLIEEQLEEDDLETPPIPTSDISESDLSETDDQNDSPEVQVEAEPVIEELPEEEIIKEEIVEEEVIEPEHLKAELLEHELSSEEHFHEDAVEEESTDLDFVEDDEAHQELDHSTFEVVAKDEKRVKKNTDSFASVKKILAYVFEKFGLTVILVGVLFLVVIAGLYLKDVFMPQPVIMNNQVATSKKPTYKHPLEFDLNNIEKFRDYLSITQSIEEKSKGESLLIKGFVLKPKQCYRGHFFMFEGGATELTQTDFTIDAIMKEHEKKVKFFTHKCTKHELKVTFKTDIGMGKSTTINAYYCPSYVDKLTDYIRRYNLTHECYGARDFDECWSRTEKQVSELYDDYNLDPTTVATGYIELVTYLVHEKGRLENADGMKTLFECQK